jgi:hypothetical protein
MPDDDRRVVIDRANRMLKQSAVLRKMADELLQEARDLKADSAKAQRKRKRPRATRDGKDGRAKT